MKRALDEYLVLPCCLLILNLLTSVVTYKAALIRDGILRTLFIIGMILFGSSLVAFALTPAIQGLLRALHRSSRQRAGRMGELGFAAILALAVFWLYFRLYTIGPASILPAAWRNAHA